MTLSITAESMSDVDPFPACFSAQQGDSLYGERKLGRLADALALGGDEGRDKLR